MAEGDLEAFRQALRETRRERQAKRTRQALVFATVATVVLLGLLVVGVGLVAR
jgi:hypothetical protein